MQDPEQLIAAMRQMSADELHHVAEAVRQVQIERAIESGDHDAVIARDKAQELLNEAATGFALAQARCRVLASELKKKMESRQASLPLN